MGDIFFRKIMVATNGSECSHQAVVSAVELARLSGGTVYAVYVVSTDYFSSMVVDMEWESMYEVLKKEGHAAVEYVKAVGDAKNVPVEMIVLEGHPAPEIIDYAEKNFMDILVIGTLGREGLERLVLGSIAGNVVRHSKVPVLVVKGELKLEE